MEYSPPFNNPSQEKNEILVSRRDLLRAALVAGAATTFGPRISLAQAIEAGLTPAARDEDGSKFLTDPDWKPLFLNDHQNETLIALGEVIIPSTDTPGAKDALANRYLDLLLSVQPAEFQRHFTDALAFIDSESQKQFANDFRSLSVADQNWLLAPWAYAGDNDRWTHEEPKTNPGQLHFARLKALIADAYYGSGIGQKELGWDGEFTHGPYQGCEHQNQKHT